MGVKLDLLHSRKNIDWEYLRTGYWRECLDIRKRSKETGVNCIIRNFIIFFSPNINKIIKSRRKYPYVLICLIISNLVVASRFSYTLFWHLMWSPSCLFISGKGYLLAPWPILSSERSADSNVKKQTPSAQGLLQAPDWGHVHKTDIEG
jgi:hypothetical protein